ncbi:ABC transporter permease [Brevibacillus choshinensis]|uniref:ABC-2 family transporter protein n=1 Tax=Brevibacillus choshinensis TaxID=54911 RepID=A0ABX7FIV3_BRECH|nr:ABC-2 family transporter protein [Brevibacillus choshinensis]QRG65549.1 ABC-2 family transporter protein [Brevibacillus choshinensis]
MVYWRIIHKSYLRNLQYRLSHFVNNVASSIFGLVFIAIWEGVLKGKQVAGPYDAETMAHYIAVCQSVLWVTAFLSPGLNVQVGVRSGAVSLDLLRPVHYLWYVLSHEVGRIAYNACYRSLPIALILGLAVGFFFPSNVMTYIWAGISLLLGVYIGLLLFFHAGITSFWTTEIRWIHYILISLLFGLGGQMIPLDLLPGFMGKVAPYLPFSGLIYYPVMIYLQLAAPTGIWIQLAWALLLTGSALLLTRMARRKLEIQGG